SASFRLQNERLLIRSNTGGSFDYYSDSNNSPAEFDLGRLLPIDIWSARREGVHGLDQSGFNATVNRMGEPCSMPSVRHRGLHNAALERTSPVHQRDQLMDMDRRNEQVSALFPAKPRSKFQGLSETYVPDYGYLTPNASGLVQQLGQKGQAPQVPLK
ncbi:uncharacterized protein CCOS01_01718, partial [Colletotrichum costaricense]